MDIADLADSTIQAELECAIERARRFHPELLVGPDRSHCVQCGDSIPWARRQVLQGVSLCLGCAEEQEQRLRLYPLQGRYEGACFDEHLAGFI